MFAIWNVLKTFSKVLKKCVHRDIEVQNRPPSLCTQQPEVKTKFEINKDNDMKIYLEIQLNSIFKYKDVDRGRKTEVKLNE